MWRFILSHELFVTAALVPAKFKFLTTSKPFTWAILPSLLGRFPRFRGIYRSDIGSPCETK